MILEHPSPYTELALTVEHGPAIKPGQMEGLQKKIASELKNELNFKAVLTLTPPDSIERTQMGKARRVIRKY